MPHVVTVSKPTRRSKPSIKALFPRILGAIMLLTGILLTVVPVAAQDGSTAVPVVTPIPADDVAEGIVDFTVQAAEGTANIFQDFLNRIITTPRSDFARVLLVMGGVLLLLVGWRIYEFIVLIAGFLIGASIGVNLFGDESTFLAAAAMLLGGVIGALLGYFLYYVAVFVIGAYIGIVLTNALATALALTPVSPIVLLLGGILGGMILIGLSFEFLILVSALVGAQMLSLGLGLDFTWTLIFAVVGVIVQLALVRATRFDYRSRRRYIYRYGRA